MYEWHELVVGGATECQLCPRRRERRQVVVAALQHVQTELTMRVDRRSADASRRRQLLQRTRRLHRDADLHQVRLVIRHLPERMHNVRCLFCAHAHTLRSILPNPYLYTIFLNHTFFYRRQHTDARY